ncbi:FKBP-type peptidyl-prolyl cis-trans isomerase [Isoalcanivorax beigongshangi]|uniref:Peptidyl-prolyl cis-trans isomerase n=1 Tax=Isoalcanivorax beigongshangi TaxID=3238810 RepID=A0ABV4AG08_9GAMM
MQIEKDKVVSLHYQLFDEQDVLIEQTSDEPSLYLHGHGNMIPGVEKALEGKQAGDKLDVTVAPVDGYGERRDDALQRVSAKYLKHAGKLKAGMQVPVQTDDGIRWVTVIKVGLKTVDVDTNHPLAGRTLRFQMSVEDVRAASAEEIEHGHAHGVGGHQH